MYYAVTLPFRAPFSILTDSSEFAKLLPLEFGQYVSQVATPLKTHVEIIRGAREYHFCFGDNVFVVKDPMLALTSFVYNSIPFEESVLPFHGAALEYDGKAHLFLAPTGGGKTTLAAYLIQCGCGYLSDDCIILNKTTFCVYPSATPLHLREGGYTVLRELNAHPCNVDYLKTESNVRITYTPKNVIQNSLPIGGVFFSSRDKRNNFFSVPVKQRVEMLLASQMVYKNMQYSELKTVISLAKHDCHFITYSDMNYVFNTLCSVSHCCARKSSTMS